VILIPLILLSLDVLVQLPLVYFIRALSLLHVSFLSGFELVLGILISLLLLLRLFLREHFFSEFLSGFSLLLS
jgi:hypothetical protein